MTEFEIVPIDASLSETAFLLVTEVFATSSTIHKAISTDLEEYRAYLRPYFLAMLTEGVSLAAIDRDQRCMLGCIIATDIYDQLGGASPSGPFGSITALTYALAAKYLNTRNVSDSEALLIDMAAVHPNAMGRGVYKALRRAVQDKAKRLGWRYVVGELSSTATQNVVLNQLGHRVVAEIAFNTFEWGETRPFAGIFEPRSIVLAEGKL